MNKQLKHIAYYTKKVNEEMKKRRPTNTGNLLSNRSNRLMQYKKMLNEYLTN